MISRVFCSFSIVPGTQKLGLRSSTGSQHLLNQFAFMTQVAFAREAFTTSVAGSCTPSTPCAGSRMFILHKIKLDRVQVLQSLTVCDSRKS